MQKRASKFLLIIFLLTAGFTQTSYSQSLTGQLTQADSLFEAKKYTEALTLYESIQKQSGKASPSMLLKMAFVYESLEDYGEALYHLNNYYKVTSDPKVIEKMSDLAVLKELDGYETSDVDFALKQFDKFRDYLIAFFLALGLLVVAISYRQKKKHHKIASGLFIMLVFIMLATGFLTNFTDLPRKGVISSANTYLMTAPSASSDLIEIVDEGHKVIILDKQDIWVEIRWKGGRAYIRESHLKPLP